MADWGDRINLGDRAYPDQLFPSAYVLSANAVWLAFWTAILFLAIVRFRTAPVLGWLLLFIVIRIITFALRVYHVQANDSSLGSFRAMQALLAVGFPVLCETVLHLVGEHFATESDFERRHHVSTDLHGLITVHPATASDSGRRHRVFTHLLGLITLGATIAGVIYAAWLGDGRELDNTKQAYVAILFVFLGLLLMHQGFRGPFLRFTTTIFLIVLTMVLCVPPIYLQCKISELSTWFVWDGTAFHLLWCLPEAVVTMGILALPLYTFYPGYRSRFIY